MQTNKQRFSMLMAATAEVYGKSITPELLKTYWGVMEKYPIEQIEHAAKRHLELGRFFPTPAELIALIPQAQANQHIDADEAWSIVLASFDEAETVVMTQQMLEARAVAWSVWSSGDEIGARMAFKAAYKRLIATPEKPVWRVVAGWDANRRLPAVEKAKQMGWLASDYKLNAHLLPAPTAQTTVAALLEHMSSSVDRSEQELEKSKQNIARIKALLAGESKDAGIERREKERQAFELHRQEVLAAVEQKLGGLH
jgi:hypothetical protein